LSANMAAAAKDACFTVMPSSRVIVKPSTVTDVAVCTKPLDFLQLDFLLI
jgi:hypothetical protein